MEQLLPNQSQVEVSVQKIASAGYTVRVISDKIHPQSVALHLTPEQEAARAEELQVFARDAFQSLPKIPSGNAVEKLVMYKSRDEQFIRGFVIKQLDDQQLLIVRNIDTRTLQYKVPLSDVRLLPSQFGIRTWPPHILQFTLARVKPITWYVHDGNLSSRKRDADKWDQAAMDHVKKLVKDKIVVCQVESMASHNGIYSVMMWTQRNSADQKPVSINEELVQGNYARTTTSAEQQDALSPAKLKKAPINIEQSLQALRVEDNSGEHPTQQIPRPPKSRTEPAFNLSKFKRPLDQEPLILGRDPVTPVRSIVECCFYDKIESQYKRGRGKGHADLSKVQTYGWPLFKQGRDSVYIFPSDGTRRMALTFIIPILSDVASGTFGSLPKTPSPKVLIIVPSCKDADDIATFCGAYIRGAMKYSVNVRKAYTKSMYTPLPELWNSQDILLITPDSLLKTYEEHRPKHEEACKYYSNTCHVVLHKSHDLFTHHVEAMKTIMNTLHAEISTREHSRTCQISLFSNLWLPRFHTVTQRFMSNPLVLLQNRMECALYSGVKTHVEEYSTMHAKLDALLRYSQACCTRNKKVAIFTSDASNTGKIYEALKCQAIPSHIIDNGHNIRYWSKGSCMVLHDTEATEFIVDDCDIVLHYDIPSDVASFSNRLSFFESHYTGIKSAEHVVSYFLLSDEQPQRVNNLVKYLTRYGGEIPQTLRDIALEGERKKQESRDKKPLCPYLRQYGGCTVGTCTNRHAVLKQDNPGSDLKLLEIPLKGKIQVKITAVADGNRFYGHMISVDSGECQNAAQQFERFHAELQTWFTNNPTRIQDEDSLKNGKVTKIAVKDKDDNQFYRANVMSTHYNADIAGNTDGVLVHYIDTGVETLVPMEQVYKMPDRQSRRKCHVVELIVCGIKPAEQDRNFSSFCLKKLRDTVIGEVLEGNIELALGNCLWVRTLEKRVLLKHLKIRSSEMSVKKLIMDNMYGVLNLEHIKLLRAKVREALPLELSEEDRLVSTSHVVDTLDLSVRHTVCISNINSPHDFHVNIVDNIDSLTELVTQLNEVKLLESLLPCWLPTKAYCIARYSKDNSWYRGEIRRTWHDKYHVYFVDYGNEDKAVPATSVKPIPPEYLEFPFQAIPCRLADVSCVSDNWTTSNEQIFTNLTLDADLNMEIASKGEDAQLLVKLWDLEGTSLVDSLCRKLVCIDNTILHSSYATEYRLLYKSADDFALLTAAEDLQRQFCDVNNQTKPSCKDVVTLCRLCRLHIADDDILLHLLGSLVYLAQYKEGVYSSILKEDLFRPLIKKLSCMSKLHELVAHLLSVIGIHNDVKHLVLDTHCIVLLCELCVYKDEKEQASKLVRLLQAVQVLCKGSVPLCKELRRTGHIRTLLRFLRDSFNTCHDEILRTLGVVMTTDRSCFVAFKDEGGLKELCRTVRRTWSPDVLDVVKLFEDSESLSLMHKEGLLDWLKKLKGKRREFHVKITCDSLIKKISAHKPEENNVTEEVVLIQPLIQMPVTRPIDQPSDRADPGPPVPPVLFWHQRKKRVGISIQIKDVGKHTLTLADSTLVFSTWNYGTHYAFSYTLFGGVSNLQKQVNKSEVLLKLDKNPPQTWTSLLADGKRSTIKLDFARAIDSDDETASEGEEEEVVVPLPAPGPDVEVFIGGSESEDEYLVEEEEVGDDYCRSLFRHVKTNSDSDDMECLE